MLESEQMGAVPVGVRYKRQTCAKSVRGDVEK